MGILADGVTDDRQLAARQLDAQIDALTEGLLRDGDFVENIADALGGAHEKVRRFHKDRDIPDTRKAAYAGRRPEAAVADQAGQRAAAPAF